ncbi:MAG TPA: MFS transporter [Candidatus Udaeobacter sp.]|nr:MFS transporter [Candidatus Udaeobacter sp.]
MGNPEGGEATDGSRKAGRPSLRSALRYSLLDGCAYSLMAGGAESYLTAFAVTLGVPAPQVGLLGSVPQLVGSAAQLGTPHGVRFVRGLKRWVVLLALAQAAILALHALLPAIPAPRFAAFLVLLSCYWTVNLAIGPAWNHWMGLLVPASRRAAYFARRNRVLHVFVLAGLAASGFFLQHAAGAGRAVQGFIAIVLAGGLLRVISAGFLALQAGPRDATLERATTFVSFFRGVARGPGRVPHYFWFMTFAVSISAPYLVPYMLEDLGLSYTTFMQINGTAFLAKSLAIGPWGHLARRIRPRRAFFLAAILIIPAPVCWAFTRSPGWLIALQIFSGAGWAGYELCQFLLFYDIFPKQRLSDVFSYYTLVNGVAAVAGTVLGGVLLAQGVGLADPYHGLFFASTAVRLLPLVGFLALGRLGLGQVRRGLVVLRVVALNPARGDFTWPYWLRFRPRRPRSQRGREKPPRERASPPSSEPRNPAARP